MEPKLDLSNLTLDKLVAAAEEAFRKEKEKKPLSVVIAAPRVTIREKIDYFLKYLEDTPKSGKWKNRAKAGENKPWYQQVSDWE